jgi:hypothetical protein
MNDITALARLQRMVAYDVEPVLSVAECTDLLSMCKLLDSDGREPTDTNWEPTYDLNLGAAEGWRWKAGKAVSMYQFSADGGNYSRNQVLEHCVEMMKQYAKKIAVSVRAVSVIARYGNAWDTWIGNAPEPSDYED